MTTETIGIRPAQAADAAALAEIHAEAWRNAYRGLLDGLDLERLISRRGPRWWKAALSRGVDIKLLEVAGQTGGYATYGYCRNRAYSAEGEIYELYLRPTFQGLGLGRELFRAVRRDLAARGLKETTVQVLTDNKPACAFYEAIGGKHSGTATHRISGKALNIELYRWPPLLHQ